VRAHSLRLRLLVGAGAWIALALLVAGIAIVLIFANSVAQDQREDLLASLDRVLTSVSAGGDIGSLRPGLGDPRYETPGGGLYWQVIDLDSGNTAQSRSLWDAAPLAASWSQDGALSAVAGPNNQMLAVISQDVVLQRGAILRRLRVSVAEDSAVRGRDIRRFALDIALAMVVLAAALTLAGWLQVHLGLRPLGSIRWALEDIGAGKLNRLEGNFPLEVLPLVAEVNSLLANHERSIAVARARADDLAHGLKTPLAVMSATAQRLRAQGDKANADVLHLLGAEMAERIDYQLRLAQLRVRTRDHTLSASLDQALIRSVAVLRKTGRGEELFWKLDTQNVTADMDPHDLMELVGVLLENAANWASSEVKIGCRLAGRVAEFEIADDGPGLSDDDIAKLGQRGKRLDEKRSGTGFGIAIASEILDLNSGSLSLSRSDAGGLRVIVRIPANVA
jgi:signal transduction histidine kinase